MEEHQQGIVLHLGHLMVVGVAELPHKILMTPTKSTDVVNFNLRNTVVMMHFKLLKDLVVEFNCLIHLILNQVLAEDLFGFNQDQ